MLSRRFARVGLGALAMWAVPHIAIAAAVANGGFETGNFAGWNLYNQSGGSGGWFVYSGSQSPLNFFTIAPPPEGVFAATTEQFGPGSHILYQDFQLEPGYHHALTFSLYYENAAGGF